MSPLTRPSVSSGASTADYARTRIFGRYKTHTLLVEIYYERMNYQVLTESPAYTVSLRFINFY